LIRFATFSAFGDAGDPKTVETKKDDSGQTADKKAFDDDVIEDFSASVLPDSGAGGEPARDPKQYCEHIQSEVKKARQRATEKKLTENLTAEDIEREREVKRKQIEDIFKLMEQHGDKFGNSTQDDLQQQMRLYL
ncbi:matrix-remodeling-associated protein 7-like, partial [Dreissena polymorpha]|uniref:matrix-remodeling-associated protein 7-like n=1 Tax=Dreissena polymorpha TaxID=45954 RepID=UPI00226413D3